MININVNESKNIEFDINVSGTDPDNIKGFLRFTKDNIEYGFPVDVSEGTVKANIPKLSSFVKTELNEGEKVTARLDIIANNDTYIMPWEDQFSIHTPLKLEAKVKEVKDVVSEDKPRISIGKILEFDTKPKAPKDRIIAEDEQPKKKIKSKFGKALEGK